MKTKSHSVNIFQLTLGALYIAVFALASNVIPKIYLIPNIPITLQTFVIAMMGLTLGVRGGMTAYLSVLILTLCGLPMMSGGTGGPGVLVGPTSGYIYGWAFLVLLTGLYSSLFMDKLVHKKIKGMSIHLPVSFAVGMAGIVLDYACGVLGIVLTSGKAMAAFPALFASNLAFLPGDIIKIGLASALSLSLFAKPVYTRILHMNQVRA